ncbi:hypothetical protein Tco_1241515, partial [Tanacetum coccineum]
RKRGAMISRGQFVARLAEHFGLLTKERLQGLKMIAWVTPGPERQLDTTAGTLEVAEGAQVVPAPVKAPQLPPTAGPTRTMT